MKALTTIPKQQNSACLMDVDEPSLKDGDLLVRMLAVGICGTDREIIAGHYGEAPEGEERLILGHETVGEVISSEDKRFRPGDLIAGIVRRPDPVPCSACAVEQWDMCENGRYTERGIKARHGFCSERFRLEADFAVPVDPKLGELGVLIEPSSVVAKAWEHVESIGRRAHFEPQQILITGAGPIGLLAALIACQKGYSVHVLDLLTKGPKPDLVKSLGASYYSDANELTKRGKKFDIVIECTGVSSVVLEAIAMTGPNGIVCLTGVSSGRRVIDVDLGGVTRQMVLENGVVFGSVNAGRGHYEKASRTLLEADRDWLSALITRRVPLNNWQEALERQDDDVKTVIVPN